jgi:hypothetical protein
MVDKEKNMGSKCTGLFLLACQPDSAGNFSLQIKNLLTSFAPQSPFDNLSIDLQFPSHLNAEIVDKYIQLI